MQYSFYQNNFSVYGNDAWVAHPFCGPTADCVTHFWESSAQFCEQVFTVACCGTYWKCERLNFIASGSKLLHVQPWRLLFSRLTISHLWYAVHIYKNSTQSKRCNTQITVHIDLGGRYGCIVNNNRRRLWTTSIPVCLRQMVSDVTNGV